jgi:PKD repeat protein
MGSNCDTGCTGVGFVFDLSTGAETTGFTDTSKDSWFNPWQPFAAAFVPGPAAAFVDTPALAGQSSSFDATGSVDPGGSVTGYHWTFGDGGQATSRSPTITHVYSRAGTYSVTLTTDNAGGCATKFIFTGQTASCTGSPTAQITRPIIIVAAAPSAAIAAPGSGETFVQGQTVPTRFACQDGTGGPGLASCTDSNRSNATTGQLATATTGAHTYTVTATSTDGQQATARITYAVVVAARHPITIHTARATIRHRRIGIRLSCSARCRQARAEAHSPSPSGSPRHPRVTARRSAH